MCVCVCVQNKHTHNVSLHTVTFPVTHPWPTLDETLVELCENNSAYMYDVMDYNQMILNTPSQVDLIKHVMFFLKILKIK